ncbi:MAG: hypothetical protein Q7U60_02575 [Candidatus Methanoperedens sp.]|nr:hypothetical protein [Candidatus Methanoperedens sp.]
MVYTIYATMSHDKEQFYEMSCAIKTARKSGKYSYRSSAKSVIMKEEALE